MKKLAWGLLLAFLLACAPAQAQVGPINTIVCNKTATFTGTGSAATVIPAVAGQNITICGWHITNTAASGTFGITAGTTATCGTGTQTITPTLSVSNTAPSADHTQYGWLSPAQGANVCVNATITTVNGLLYYSQQ